MLRLKFIALGWALAAAAPAGAISSPDELAPLSDEFDQNSLSPDWSVYHDAFGWPNKIKTMDVGRSVPGSLHLQPYHSAWVRDLSAPFLFKNVQGDFDVRARVRVRGLNGPIPDGTWSLGGLMARVPNRLTADNWQPRMENWHFITTGVGHEAGKVMTETKGTYNSYSSLKLRPYHSGWIELRLVRVGMALFALARPNDKSPWEVRDRFYRMEGSPQMQVGLIAYTHSKAVPSGPDHPEAANREVKTDAPVDMALDVDWVRFSRPKIQSPRDWYAQVNGSNKLTNPGLTDAEILAALGA